MGGGMGSGHSNSRSATASSTKEASKGATSSRQTTLPAPTPFTLVSAVLLPPKASAAPKELTPLASFPSPALPNPVAAPAVASNMSATHPPHRKLFTRSDVQQMISVNPDRTVVIIGDQVYDVTSFLSAHPGGPAVLRRNNGKDVTDIFYSMHSPSAVNELPSYLIGNLEASAGAASPAPTADAAPADATGQPSTLRMEEIHQALRADPNRIIVVLFGDAYDVTPMRDGHPGGLRVLLNHNGRECGETFMRIHGLHAKWMTQQYFMGPVEGLSASPSPLRSAHALGATSAAVRRPSGCKVNSTRMLEIEPVNASATIQYFMFTCAKPLHLIPGGHVKLLGNAQDREGCIFRPFRTDVASFSICAKSDPEEPTSRYLFGCAEGDEVFYEGPFAPPWQLNMDAVIQDTDPEDRHVLLIAGGTGLAPLYSIAANALETQAASITLICSARTPDDFVLSSELRDLAARYSKPTHDQRYTLRVAVALTHTAPQDEAPSTMSFATAVFYGERLAEDALRSVIVAPVQAAVICGPPTFNEALAAAVVKASICGLEQVHLL